MAAATVVTRMPTVGEMRDRVRNSAFVFRGYNVTNLGRTPELLAHGDYGPIVADYLRRASTVCSDITQRPCDLVERVEQQRETDLESYADAIALIVAVELAQLEILREVLDIAPEKAKLLYGFSLGEITALMAAGVLKFEDALRI
ncbi:MAG: hypothetical protein KDA99_19120, partial [Planctomycetales bacterium]|nr:hypothetical protein [Planctomycetales bacterium]